MIPKEKWSELLYSLSEKKFSWSVESDELFRFTHPATTDVGLLYRCHANSFVSYSINANDDSIRIGSVRYHILRYGKDEHNKFFLMLQRLSGRHAGRSSTLVEVENN